MDGSSAESGQAVLDAIIWEDEAAVDLAYNLPKRAYKLDG